MKVAIQGLKASYHDIARKEYFSNSQEIVHCDTFKEVFEAIENKSADYGLVAIENSLYGSINDVYDLLKQHNFYISGEIYLRINHCLLGTSDAKLSDVKQVHSQLPALAQCEDYLDANLPKAERVEEHDTAASAKMVAEQNNSSMTAIASKEAAKLHGLKILARDIESNKQNYTRFIIFGKQRVEARSANKTSLIVRTSQDAKAGSLYNVLGVFANKNINLSKIESRPIIGKAWHYMFYLDFEVASNSNEGQSALAELKSLGAETIVLGSYTKGKIIE